MKESREWADIASSVASGISAIASCVAVLSLFVFRSDSGTGWAQAGIFMIWICLALPALILAFLLICVHPDPTNTFGWKFAKTTALLMLAAFAAFRFST